MSKILVIPDIHGKAEVLEKALPYFASVDTVVQLGDIVDTEDTECSDETLLEVFYSWQNYKMREPKKFHLLWGNHELAYLCPEKFAVPKHRVTLEKELGNYLRAHYQDYEIAWEIQMNDTRWLLTHAGVTQSFSDKYLDNHTANKITKKLQELFTRNPDIFWQDDSPIWARDNLMADPLKGYNQIVGHTPLTDIQKFNINGGEIIRADTWHYLRGTRKPMGTQRLILIDESGAKII